MIAWRIINNKSLANLEQHYMGFEPYCHFNIIDLWCYRVGSNYWFKIGDTIAYRLNDYMDDDLYYTLLGRTSAKDAIKRICELDKKQAKLTFRCVPDETLKVLGDWDAIISTVEDKDNHDYIYSVETLIEFNSPTLKKQQKLYNKVVKKHPNLHVKPLNNNDKRERRLIYNVFKKWIMQTESDDWHKEYLALTRALNIKGVELVCLGFFDGKKMIGYTINGPESNGYYQAFFGKANRKYRGLSIYQEYETARYMNEHYDSKYMNLQPDCGIEGLRSYKQSLDPIRMLKKYTVVIDATKAAPHI